jgi:hypothetical protein
VRDLRRLYAGFCGILAENPAQKSHSRTRTLSRIAGFCEKKNPQSARTRRAGFLHDILNFVDAYRHGLNGDEAAWANKRYRGHRVLPPNIVEEIQEECRRQDLCDDRQQSKK